MRRITLFTVLALTVVAATSCRARFKKFARAANTVEIKVIVVGSPVVDLVESSGDSDNLIEAAAKVAVNTAASVESVKVQERVQNALRPREVQEMVHVDAVDHLGNGPPFGSAKPPVDGMIQIAVENYGIVQSGGGPAFFVDYFIEGFRSSDNKKIYRNRVSCSDRVFSTINTPANVAGTVATISHLNAMTDAELQQALQRVVSRCTASVVAEMRKHAS